MKVKAEVFSAVLFGDVMETLFLWLKHNLSAWSRSENMHTRAGMRKVILTSVISYARPHFIAFLD